MVSPWETRPPGDVVLTHSFWAAFFRQALGLLVGVTINPFGYISLK